jgi:hypothetical protein
MVVAGALRIDCSGRTHDGNRPYAVARAHKRERGRTMQLRLKRRGADPGGQLAMRGNTLSVNSRNERPLSGAAIR